MSPASADRIGILDNFSLLSGAHDGSDETEMCVMEAVAYIAGEPWSDHPNCACPVISAFLRSWNDCLPTDEDRNRLLKPLVLQLIDTKSTAAIEEKRSYLALDWMVRVFVPKWLDLLPTLHSHSAALRSLEDIADIAGALAAGEQIRAAAAAAGDAARAAAGDAARAAARAAAWDAARAAARAAAGDAAWAAAWDAARAAAGDAAVAAARAAAGDAARAAARAAAGDAAWAAAWDAARAAARAAAGDAAWAAARAAAGDAAWAAAWDAAAAAARAAAGDAAWAAARAAAGDAAWDAAWDAAGAALKPTTEWLQASALDLVARMIRLQP
jgi:hypothetical protein